MGQLVKESINNYDNGVREDSSLAPSYDKAAANRLINLHINKSNPTNTELAPINFGKSRFDKYVDLQYQPDRLKQQKQLEQLRGEEQSGIEQFGAALNQAIVGEVIGGTLEGAGYYGQLLQGKANVVDGAGMNYHNGLSQAGKAIREWAEENTPIYQAADPDGSMLQDMTHWSWYMKQLPSVASTASLMLPGLGAVKLAGGIGKVLQLADKFTKAEKVIGASLLQATVSRYGENAMEAGNNWDETYNKYIQQGANEKDAVLAANKAAEYTFKANWAMLTQDIASALFMNIPGTKAATANGLKTAKAMGVDIAPVMVKDLGKRVLSASGEGLEEAYQYIASEEGKHYADMQMNPDNKKDSALSSRFGKYIQSKDLWTSALFGAIGGGVTEFAFDKLNGEQRIDENKARQIQEMPNIIRKMYDSQYEAEQIGTESAKKATKLNNIADLATNASTLGNMDNIKTIMSSMKSMSPEEYSKILGEGVSNEEIAEFQKNINDNLRHLDTFKSLYEKHAKTKEPEIAANLARVSFLKDNYNKERVNTKSAIDSLGVDLWSNFKDLTDNNGNVVGLTNSINNYLQNNFIQKSSKNTVTFFENKLKKDKDLTDEQKKTYTDLINEHKKISNDALIDNKTIYAEMTTSEKEGLNKLGKEGTDVFNEIVQKKTSLSFIDASLKTFDKQLSVLSKVTTVEEYNNTVNKTTKSAIENIVKEIEAQRKKDLEEQQLAKVAEEAAKADENNELAKVEEIVDKISKGEKIEDPELLQVQANNPNLVEQGLKDKAKEEVENKIKDEQAIDPIDTEIKQDIQEPVESVEAEEKETAPEELEVTEQITETPVIDTLLENNKLTERKFETTLQGQIYVHDILWFDPIADYTGKNGWVDAPNSELVKLLQDPNVNLEDIKFSGKFQTFGSNEDVDTIGIAYNFKLGGKKFAFYVKDATYDNLKDKFVGREDQIETTLTELRVQRALILNEINKAKEDVAKGNIAFVKPVSISLSNGIPNFTQVYTNVQDVFNNLFKKLFGEKDGKLDYNGINTNKVHFGIGYNFGTILNSKMERIHNANVTNKGALYMVIPGSEMSGKQDEAVRLNVPYLKDIQFGGNKLSEVLLYTLLEGVYYNQESLKLRKNGLSQQVPNSSFKYVSLLKLFSNYGVSNTVSDFNIEYEENKPILILNGKRYNVAALVTTTNNVVRQEVLDILDSKLLQVSLKKLDSSLKEALGFKNKQWDARWGDSINIPFVDITLSKDEFENMSYIGFLMSKNLIKTNLDKQQPFKAPYVYFQGVETVKPIKNYTKIVTETEKPDTSKIDHTLKSVDILLSDKGIGGFRSDEQIDNNKKTFKDALPKFLQNLFDDALNVELDNTLKNTANFEKITRNGKQTKRIRLGKGAKLRDFLHEVIHSILDGKFTTDEILNLRSRATSILKRISELNEEDSAVGRMLNAYTGVGHSIEEEIATWYLTQKAFRDEINNSTEIAKNKVLNLIKEVTGFTQEQIDELVAFDESVNSEQNVEDFVKLEESKNKYIKEFDKAKQVIVKTTEKPDVAKVVKPNKAANIFANSVGLGIKPKSDTKLNSLVSKEPFIQGNIDEATVWLADKLNTKPNVTQGLINVSHLGLKAYGTFSKDGITLSTQLSKGTEYHEAFHRVSLLLLTDSERELLHKEVADIYGITGDLTTREEWLAEAFKKYVLFGELPNKIDKKQSIISKVFNWFLSLFKSNKKLNNSQVYNIFKGIQEGTYKNTKEQRTFDDINKLFNTDNTTLLTEVDGVTFNYIRSAGQFEEIVNNIFITTLSLNNVNAIKGSIINLDFDKTKDLLEQARNAFIEDGADAQVGFYNEIIDNFELFKNRVENELKAINFKKQRVEEEDLDKEQASTDVTGESIAEHTKVSYEINPQENALAEIKVFLKTLPQVERTEMGELVAVTDEFSGMLKPIVYGKIWNQLMDDLHGIKSIEGHIQALNNKANVIPIYEYIASKLSSMPDQFKTQWLVTFNKHKHAMTNTLYTINTKYGPKMELVDGEMQSTGFEIVDETVTFRQGDANIQKPEKFYVKDWGNSFLNSELFIHEPNKKTEVNKEKLTEQISEFNIFVTSLNTRISSNRNFNIDIEIELNNLVEGLNAVGIKVDYNTMLHLLNDIDVSDNISKGIINKYNAVNQDGLKIAQLHKYLTRSTNNISYLFSNTLKELVDKGKVLTKNRELEFSDVFKNESAVAELARYYTKDNPIASQSTTLGPDGNAVYQYAPNSYLTDVVNDIKTNVEFKQSLFESVYSEGSYIANTIKEYNNTQLDKSNILTALNFIQDNSGDKGKGYLDMSPMEDYLFKMANIHNNQFIVPTLADKKPYFMFTGIPTILDKIIVGKEINFSDNVLNVFRNYFNSEIKAIKDAYSFYELNKDNPDKLVKNYHTYKSNKNGEGNGMRFRHFVDLNAYFENDELRKGKTVLEIAEALEKRYADQTVLDGMITKALKAVIKEEIKFASKIGLIEEFSEFKLGNLKNNYLDNNRFTTLKNEFGNNEGLAVYQMIAEFTINNVIAINEFERLVSKDPAFYKDRDDVIKRLSAITSTGDNLDTGAMKRTQYSSITLKDNEIPSAYTKVLHTRVYNALKDILGEDAATEQANKVVESYDSVNQTDAQVYISPNMYKDILKGLGEWDDATYGKAFDILENENWEGDTELTKQALNIVMQPLKMVHFGDYFMDNMDVPMYDKMSLACLFKSLVKGTDLQPLYDRMNNSTLGKVDMVKFESAVKVGLNKPFQYYKNSDMTEINDLNNVVTKTQDFKYLRRQLLTDPHHVDEAMLGTQVLKAAMSNINNEIGYNVAGTELKGSALKTEYIESMKALSNIGKKEMLEELGIEEKENGEYTINKPKLIEFLARDAKSSGLPYNITNALKVVGNEFLLELAAHPDAAWIESRFTSLVNKKIIDTFMPGNAFIQMSNFGLKELGNKPVSRTSNDIKDLPSYGKNGELAFMTEDGYMECAVSINLFSSVIPDYENKSFKESAKWLLDNLDLLAMGYRIPTQGLSSISALKVVKILPETTGDTIVLPAEFTKKTGSDFDIDKLYVARYNYKYNKNTGKVEKVQFNDFENAEDKWIRNSKAANQNRLLDCFMSVLTNPYHLNDTMMSLDRLTEILKKEILSDLEKGKIKEPIKTFTHASPQYQSNKKYEYTSGKTGIGPFALNNVHHVLGQMTALKFNETEFLKRHNMTNVNGIVGEDGEKILDWLSTLINAHVDVAKDPYIIKLGVVSYTYNVTNLLLRTGKGASTFYFLPQPIIKDLAKAVNQLEGNIGVDKEKKQKDYEKEVLTKYFKELEKLTKTDQQKELTNKLKNWILKGEANTIDDRNLFDIDWLKETLQPSDTYKFYARQLLIGGTYLELEKNYAKPLGDLVMASRIDTKKFGNSVIMQRQFVKQMNDVLAANVFENASDLFEKTFLAEKAKLSIGYKDDIGTLRKIFKSFLISTTNPFIEAVDKIMTLSGRSISQDEVFVRNIAKNIKSNIFSEFFNESLKSSEQTYESMLYGDRSMAVRLDNLKKMINTDERLVDLKNNPLLDILNYDKVDSEIMDTPSLLTTPGSRISDKNSKDMVTLGWKDMLTFTHPDTNIEKAVQTFAKDLINYAWISSGSNPGPNSIYSYIPFDYLIDNGFNQFVKDKLESINNTNDLSEILTEESIESIYKNLWNNDNIVPLIKNEYVQLLNNKQTVKATSKIHGVSYNKTLVFPLKLVRSLKLNTNGVYKPFIKVKINKDNVKDQVFTVLYKFVGVNQERDKKGNIREIPVYNAVNKKGYFNKGKNIFEFNTLNNSTFTFNNVEEGSYIPYIEEPIIKVNDFSMTSDTSLLDKVKDITDEQANERKEQC